MSNVVRNIVYMLSILVKASALDVLKETMVPVGDTSLMIIYALLSMI